MRAGERGAAHPTWLGTDHHDSFQTPGLSVIGAEQLRAHAFEQLGGLGGLRYELAADVSPETAHQPRLGRERRVVGPARLRGDRRGFQRLAHGDDGADFAAGGLHALADQRVDFVGGTAQEYDADATAREQPVYGERPERADQALLF